MSYLRFEGLRKSVGERLLLDIPSLTLEAGAITLVQGRNGSGKTTLLKILAGLLAPEAARIFHEGRGCSWRAFRRRCHRQVIYLHQQAYMFDGSVAANVGYGLRHAGVKRGEFRHRLASALDWADLQELAQRNARELSGGEKQRVALARAWALAPRILLLDEPTAHLDSEAREVAWRMVGQLGSEGVGVLVTSHEDQRALPPQVPILHLEHGALHAEKYMRNSHAN